MYLEEPHPALFSKLGLVGMEHKFARIFKSGIQDRSFPLPHNGYVCVEVGLQACPRLIFIKEIGMKVEGIYLVELKNID